MKRTGFARSMIALSIFAMVALLLLGAVFAPAAGQMMGGGMKGMREMMQRMMPGALPPGIDPRLLPEPESKGARLLARYCTQCHNLPGPGMHTNGEWPAVIERMQARIKMHNRMMGGGVTPNLDELAAIGDYLRRHAMRPLDPDAYSDLGSPGGRAFRETCAQCHALPDPKLHASKEWPAVVTRMRRNMTVMGKTPVDQLTTDRILKFLRDHAAINR